VDLWLRGIRGFLLVVVMVEDFADTPARALCDFACAPGGAHADILASGGSASADIAGGFGRVQGDQVARTFANAFGCRSSALCGSFADVSGAPAHVATGAGLMGLLLSGRLRCAGWLRRGLGLGVLATGVPAADGQRECEERDGWFEECSSHDFSL